MSSPTIRIRLAKQPPLYLLGAVVVASLCPLLIQLWGTPAVASIQRLPALVAAPDALQPVRMPAVVGEPDVEPEPETAPAPAAAVDEPEPERAPQDPEELDAVVILEEPAAPAPRPTPPPARAKPKPAVSAPSPTLAQRAKAACARKDKATARTAYRRLPLGDARRKEIRRACREQGVWVL